jgi:hypothetical protein
MGCVGLVGWVRERGAGAGRREALGGLLAVPVVLAVLGCWDAGGAQGLESVRRGSGGGVPVGRWALALGAGAGAGAGRWRWRWALALGAGAGAGAGTRGAGLSGGAGAECGAAESEVGEGDFGVG